MKKPTSRRRDKKDPAAGLPIRRTVAAYDRAVAGMEAVLREWIGQQPYAAAARLARTPGASYSSLREFHLKRASIQHETLVAILQNIELTGPDRKRCDDLRVEFLAWRDEMFRYVRRRLRSVEPKIAFRLIAGQAERQDAAAPDRTTIETLAGPESERRVRAGTVRNIAWLIAPIRGEWDGIPEAYGREDLFVEAEQVVMIARTELRTLDPERLVMTLLFKGGGSLVLAEQGEKHTLAAIVRRVLAATGAGTYEQLTGARVRIRGFATDPRGMCFGIGRVDGPGYYEDRGRFHACQDQLWSDRNRKSEARKKQK